MIKFCCDNCGQRLKVSEEFSGRKCSCPKCHKSLLISAHPEFEFELGSRDVQSEIDGDKNQISKSAPLVPGMFDIPLKGLDEPVTRMSPEEQSELLYKLGVEKQAEQPVPKRKLPFFVDIFLYPLSVPGLIMLGIFVGIPLIIGIIAALMGPFGFFIAIPGMFISAVVYIYMYWYICLCVRDSAEGNIRAPDLLADSPSLWDMFIQTLRIFLCLLFFGAPVFLYFQYTHRADFIFWLLSGYGLFFFPMGLLAVIMYDSIEGLNPLLIIKSIAATLFQYFVLFFLFAVVVGLYVLIFTISWLPSFLRIFSDVAFIYLLLILAHLLGRFYWRNSEKLQWEV